MKMAVERAVKEMEEANMAVGSEEALTFGALDGQPKVRILLPKVAGDPLNQPQEVFLNGVPYFVPRGVGVAVPEDIASLLQDAALL